MITEFKLAEVISTNTYSDDASDKFNIVVKSVSDVIPKQYDNVRPASLNDLSIPLPGEHVLIFIGLRQTSNEDEKRYDWFYLTTYALQSSINNNLLPGVTFLNSVSGTTEITQEWKNLISQKTIKSLQPYPGDRLIQGRWGNRFRLGSTVKNQDTTFSKQPIWKKGSGEVGDPIIILSNSAISDNTTGFAIENPNSDYSSLYLTSTQEIPGYTIPKFWKQENEYRSHFIGIADRINLNAKTDSVTINAVSNIELNSNTIVFGTRSNTEKEPGIHYTELKFVLDSIVTILSEGFENKSGDILVSPKNKSLLTDVKAKIQQIRNDGVWFDQSVDTLVNNNIT